MYPCNNNKFSACVIKIIFLEKYVFNEKTENSIMVENL